MLESPMLRNWLHRVEAWWRQTTIAPPLASAQSPEPVPAADSSPRRLERVVLSEGVATTLFDDYALHRRSPRGREEIGWILLGVRREADAVALAALPAGAERDASDVHVRFNADAQALASRILRQGDKRLDLVGVVHTHPGTLCRPSAGDLSGDSAWVANLRQREAVFGIGTAAGCRNGDSMGELQFSWYALAAGEPTYRPLPAVVEPGLDLAAPLRPIWDTLEANAAALERLCRLFARVRFERADGGLAVRIALPEPNQGLRLLLKGSQARYYWERGGELIAVDPGEPQLDRAVFLILAELTMNETTVIRANHALVES